MSIFVRVEDNNKYILRIEDIIRINMNVSKKRVVITLKDQDPLELEYKTNPKMIEIFNSIVTQLGLNNKHNNEEVINNEG